MRHVYRDGVCVRSVHTREVEWDAEQQSWMLALDLYRREHCEGCGRPLAESTAKANEYGYDVTPIPCHACERIASARDQHMENNPYKHSAPARWSVRLRKG